MGLIDRRQRSPIPEELTASGSANAAKTKMGPYRDEVSINYHLSAANGDLVVEESDDGSDWDEVHRIGAASLTTGAEAEVEASTIGKVFGKYVRVWYGGADGDITEFTVRFS